MFAKLRLGEWLVIGGSLVIFSFACVVGYMIYTKPPPVRFVNVETTLGKKGEKVFKREFCLSCHEVFAIGATYGPNLDGIGSKRTNSWLTEFLKQPRPGVSDRPYRLKMPAYDSLSDEEMTALVAYLQGLQEIDEQGRQISPSIEVSSRTTVVPSG